MGIKISDLIREEEERVKEWFELREKEREEKIMKLRELRELRESDFREYKDKKNWKLEREDFENFKRVYLNTKEYFEEWGGNIWEFIERDEQFDREFESYLILNEEEKEKREIEFRVRMVLFN